MQLPHDNAHYSVRVEFGTYVVRRLKRAQFTALATDIALASAELKAKGRAWEDSAESLQNAMADRDGADDDLDDNAQHARANLGGRSVSAVKEAPYTLIFPQGIGYYTAARLEDEVGRYTEFGARVSAHLPDGDSIKAPTLQANTQGIADFQAGTAALQQAALQRSMLRTELLQAVEAWNRLMEKIYGLLVAELGKKAAERFFPKSRNKSKGKEDEGGEA